jgi:hypothetical protein
MSNSLIVFPIFAGLIVLLLSGIMYAITHKNTQCSGSFASMVVFHDMQTREKQKAVEIIIEQKAEKRWKEQENGKDWKYNV